MSDKQLVLAIFDTEAQADDAADGLKAWAKDSGTVKLGAVGILVLDDKGQLKTHKVGARSVGAGAGIGVLLALVMPVGLVAGAVVGGAVGALHHKGLGVSDEDRERIGGELKGGKAAVGVAASPEDASAIAKQLTALGGAAETHDLDDAAVAAADKAVAADGAPADPAPAAS